VMPLDTNARGATISDFVTGTSYIPPGRLVNQHTYRWSVSALFSINGVTIGGPPSAELQFTVSVPGTPTLSGPSGTVTTHTPTLQWSSGSGAAGYALTLHDTTSDTKVLDQLPVSGTSYTPTTPRTNGRSYR